MSTQVQIPEVFMPETDHERTATLLDMLEDQSTGIAIVTADDVVLYMNAAALVMVEAESLTAAIGTWFRSFVQSVDCTALHHVGARDGADASGTVECEVRGADGAHRRIAIRAEPLTDVPDCRIVQLRVVHDRSAGQTGTAAPSCCDGRGWRSDVQARNANCGQSIDDEQGFFASIVGSPDFKQLCNDLLDFASLKNGDLTLAARRFSLAAVLTDVIALTNVSARQKGLALRLRCGPGVPARLVGDPVQLQRVLLSLLGNAVRFTARGEVSVYVRIADCRLQIADFGKESLDQSAISNLQSGITLHFSVRDTGGGIAPALQDHVFDAFVRGRATDDDAGGAGLGLTISRRLVEMMGGRMWLESEVGEGATFHFIACFDAVSVSEPTHDRPASTAPIGERSLHVLLAEDNAINQRVAQRLLERRGHAVTVASNGREAVDAFERMPFDVVLMDVQMPEMDGFAATAAIRQLQEASGQRVPIIAVTAHAMKGDEQRCLAAGMDGYVSKPIDTAKLFAVIDALVAPEQNSASSREVDVIP